VKYYNEEACKDTINEILNPPIGLVVNQIELEPKEKLLYRGT